MRLRHVILLIILIFYAFLGVLFAAKTPAWQAPDEPAHYNYVRFVATTGGFPELRMGDYPHEYLEEIKSRKFPPDLSIDPIRYEFHQPPLYYALLAPVYKLTGGALLPLRLASVLMGAGVVLLAYAVARRVCPRKAQVALGTAAFVAFLPQHLAGVAQVGNDVLGELLFAAVLYILAGWVLEARGSGETWRIPGKVSLALGALLGLILVTKTTAYIAIPLAGGVLLWRWWQERPTARQIVVQALLVILPAALIAFPWYARDLAIYGWPDFLGLIRHDQIVVGQTRTGDFLATVGWDAYMRRAVEFTFKSFWGVFGWLGVFMDSRVYFALAVLSGVAVGGLVLRIMYCVLRGREPQASCENYAPRTTHYALRLFAISVLFTFLTYAWYNTQFVQHQGRYLFTALIPFAIAFTLGWEAAVTPRNGRILAAILALCAAALAAWGVLTHIGLPKWPIAITLLTAAGLAALDFGLLAAERLRQQRWSAVVRRLAFALPFAVLPLLSLYALFRAIVPQLAR